MTETTVNFSILQTNDLHSAFVGTQGKGHYASLATAIEEIRARNPSATILVDSGDFYSGSIFHQIAPAEIIPYENDNDDCDDHDDKRKEFYLDQVPELFFFERLKYDAITLGNHDFEAGEDGLRIILEKAQLGNFTVPIVISNAIVLDNESSKVKTDRQNSNSVTKSSSSSSSSLRFMLEKSQLGNFTVPIVNSNAIVLDKDSSKVKTDGEAKDLIQDSNSVTKSSSSSSSLPALFSNLVQPYIIKSLHYGDTTLKVGIIGTMGPDSAFACRNFRESIFFQGGDDVPQKNISRSFKKYIKVIEETAAMLIHEKGVSVVVLVAHSGHPEDVEVAKAIKPNLVDVMISGHTHHTYIKTISKGKSARPIHVIQSDCQGFMLGCLNFSYDTQTHSLTLESSEQIEIDPHTQTYNEIIKTDIERWGTKIPSTRYQNFRWNDTIYRALINDDTVFHASSNGDLPLDYQKLQISDLLTNALVEQLEKKGHHADVYLFPPGAIRDVVTPIMTEKGEECIHLQFADIFRILSTTERFPIAIFELPVSQFLTILTLVPLLRRFMSPLISISYSPDRVKWKKRWYNISFVNSFHTVQINGVEVVGTGSCLKFWKKKKKFNETGRIRIATNSFLAQHFWRVKEYTKGLVNVAPMNEKGEKIAKDDWEDSVLVPSLYEPALFSEWLMSK